MKWFLKLNLAIFFTLFILYVADLDISWESKNLSTPQVTILVDKSRSIPTDIQEIIMNELKSSLKNVRIEYFSEIFSEDPVQVPVSGTALWDTLSVLQKNNQRFLVISDFRDTASILTQQTSLAVYPVIITNKLHDTLGILQWDFPEKIQSSEKTKFRFSTYQEFSGPIKVTLLNKARLIQEHTWMNPSGLQTHEFKLTLPEGYNILTLKISGPDDQYTNNNAVDIMTQSLPDNYKVLFIAGRPSSEAAFLNRFLRNLPWIRVDTHFLIQTQEKFKLDPLLLGKYNALVLIDIDDSTILNIDSLKNFSGKILYIPGLRDNLETKILNQKWEIPSPENKIREIPFSFVQDNVFIKTKYSDTNYVSQKDDTIIFLGWDTWKWNLIDSGLNLQNENYPRFWKPILTKLLRKDPANLLDLPLNYSQNDVTPLGILPPGHYLFSTNDQKVPFIVHPDFREMGNLSFDLDAAKLFRTNVWYFHPGMNWQKIVRETRGENKIVTTYQHHFQSRKSWLLLIFMLLSICMFWFLSDREMLKS